MLNFSKDNLIEVDKSTVASHSLAIKVNDMVLLCGSGNGSDSPGGGTGGGSGTFDLAKVTEYSPATPAVQLVTSVEVSGFEDRIWSDDPDSEDYEYNEYHSEANGTYNVTPDTAGETDWRNRIYKHESKEYYIYYEYYDDYPEESSWFIGESLYDSFIRKYNDWDYDTDEMLPVGDLESGTSEWGDYDWEPFSVTLDVHTVEIPATPMVLKGVIAKRYDGELRAWIVGTEEFSLGAYNIPKIGRLYALADNCTVGNEIASDAADAIPRGFTSNTSIDGYVINQSSGGGSYPDAWCIFNQNYTEGDYAWWTGSVGISESNPGWFSIEVPVAFVPSGIWIMNEIQSPENFKNAVFQGSNDGSTWEDIYTINNRPNTEGYRQEHLFSCNKAYNHFRMFFTASHASGVSIQAFKIYKLSFIEEE